MEIKPSGQRRQYSEEERRQLVAAWRKSGLSADAFSQQTGLGRSNLWRWSRAIQEKGAPRGGDAKHRRNGVASSFVELQVGHDPGARQQLEARADGQTPLFEIEEPFGLRVRVYRGADAETLRQLLAQLPKAARC